MQDSVVFTFEETSSVHAVVSTKIRSALSTCTREKQLGSRRAFKITEIIKRKPNEDNIKREKNQVIFEVKSEESVRYFVMKLDLAFGNVSNNRLEAIEKVTAEDETMKGIMQLIREGCPESKNDLRDDIKAFWQHKDSISCQNGVLYRGKQVIIPRAQQKVVIEKVHQAHNGIHVTIQFAAERVFWPGMKHQIEDRVKQCTTCAKFSASQKKLPMKSHEVPEYPIQYVSMDCCEFIIEGKKMNLLITVDHYSDFFEVEILPNMTPGAVIRASKANFARHGIPQKLCTDNGTNFVKHQMRDFAKDYNFQHVTSSPIRKRQSRSSSQDRKKPYQKGRRRKSRIPAVSAALA